MAISANDIVEFWYSDRVKKQWFSATQQLDKEILDNYQSLWVEASSGNLDHWLNSPKGCLALAIILDQFPLNMFRGKPEGFKTEQQAVSVAKLAVEKGLDQKLGKEKRAFLYMPLMHSENLADQDLSVKLFRKSGLANNAKFAEHHREIVRRFGRFPHRNRILGRTSTQTEEEYLASDKAFKG